MSFHLRLSYIAFLLFLAISTVLLKPAASTPLMAILIMMAAKILPLTLFAPAVWREKGNGLMTLTLVLLLYMGFATMDCFAQGLIQILGFIELGLASWLIVVCSKVVKRQPRGQGAL